MYDKLAHQQYRTVQISTIDRGRLLLMMYDGGIKFLRQAKSGLESKDIPKFARFLSKAQAIIAELDSTLDFEAGGEIAKDLNRLYDFMMYYLTEANLQKDPVKIQRVIDLLDTIATAYRQIVEGDPIGTQRAVQELQERLGRVNPMAPIEEEKKPSSPEPLQPGQLRIAL